MIPDLNGRRVSLTNATINVHTETIIGANGLKVSEKQEPGEVEGASSVPVGYTDGPWSGTAGFAAPHAEALRLKKALGSNFGRFVASASFTYTALDSSDGVTTIELPAFRIVGVDWDGGDRSKAAMITFELKLLEPAIWDGVSMVEPDDLAGLGSFLLSAFGG